MCVEEIHYVYGLIDPRTHKVFYIGRTKSPNDRLREHIKNAARKDTRKNRHIVEILSKGFEPKMTLLESGNKQDIIQKENEYIKKYSVSHKLYLKNDNHNPLTTDELERHWKFIHQRDLRLLNERDKYIKELESIHGCERCYKKIERLEHKINKLHEHTNRKKEQIKKLKQSIELLKQQLKQK
jgi:predicted GIY-YIG superfamily endonuclease